MAEMVVNGVSSRKVSTVMETLCGSSFSKSTVSEACKELDKAVEDFRSRSLTDEYPFVMADATYFKDREAHRVVGKALMVAIGTTETGKREIPGFGVYTGETKETWRDFLEKLKKRGLHGVKMITSDAHEGIIHAIGKIFPEVPWRRCQMHFSRNVPEHAPKKYQADIHRKLLEMYHCDTLEEAQKVRDSIIYEYRDVAENTMACLEKGFDSVTTVLAISKSMRRFFRTSNHLERLNKELKKHSNVIGVFPNEASLFRLMGGVLLEMHERYITHSATHFKKEDAEKLAGSDAELRRIAKAQQALIAA